MRILIDVCLSPDWVDALQRGGLEAVHWTTVGSPGAKDREIIKWAREEGCIIFAHDLDFSTILALTRASGPSVVQVRAQDVLPSAIGSVVLEVLAAHGDALEKGAILSIDETTSRVRILPVQRRADEQGDAAEDAARRR